MDQKFLLTVCELNEFKETKVSELMFDVIFENESQLSKEENGQQKCRDIMFPFARSPLKSVRVKKSNILYTSKDDSTNKKVIREITLDFKDFKEFDWQPGDTIAILPNNDKEDVVELLKRLELESKADTKCSITISKSCTNKRAKVPLYIPYITTPREILRDCLNLKSILKKGFLRNLAEYCLDAEEKKFLKCISSKEGSAFYDFMIKKSIPLIDVLKLCPTCKPPFSLIVEHLSRLLPRPYSISSSPLRGKDQITFIYSILESEPGVTTKMLKEKSLYKTSSLLIYLREANNFRYIEDNYEQNQILIAIGTGLAPFLGFLQHKQHLIEENKGKAGFTWLFIGTTTPQSLIHREVLLEWQSKSILSYFVECYSRSPVASFRYVHDALNKNSKEFVELLMNPETNLYLCADGGDISKSIEKTLQIILSKELSIAEADAVNMIKDFKTKGKYREDIWL